MKISGLLTFLVCLAVGVGYAASCLNDPLSVPVVSGIVLDKTGAPVANAVLELKEKGKDKLIATVLTSSSGRFTFGQKKKGEYLLSVRAKGFVKTETFVTIVPPPKEPWNEYVRVELDIPINASTCSNIRLVPSLTP